MEENPSESARPGREAALSLIESRKRPDLRALYEMDPGICGLAMFIDIYDDPTLTREHVRCDGKAIYIGPDMANLPEAERAYRLAHAILHHALRHPRRMGTIAHGQEHFEPWIWNLAADAIVNDTLDRIPALHRPASEIAMEQLLEFVPDARMCSLEQLYRKLKNALDDIAMPPELEDFIHDDIEPEYVDPMNGSSGNSMGTLEDEKWNERIKKGFGRYPAGLDLILRHMPKSKTPWQRILRSLVVRHIGAKTKSDPSRPHRRWLTLEPEYRDAGINLPLIPGSRPMPQARIAVAIDTSLSVVSSKLLEKFMGEICGIMRQMSVGVRVITIDADVHQVQDFSDPNKLLTFVPKGGGGTAFEPAIVEAEAFNPSVMIYLTDLEGPAPHKPKFPVIWATPKGTAIEPPFGMHLEIE